MATSKNGKLQFESGQTYVPTVLMTDSGDHQIHTAGTVWSNKSGFAAAVKPNGVVIGNQMLSPHATNDTFNHAEFIGSSIGIEYTVSAGADTITRPAGDVSKINSITMDSSGAIAVIAGVDGASTAFIETRGGNGGPPYIPVDSVEIGQIRVTTQAAGAIASTEIFQVPGTHVERFDGPVWDENPTGNGLKADVAAERTAHIKLADVLPAIHTADAYKRIYIEYYTPVLAQLAKALDFTDPSTTHSVTSTQYYDGVAGASSSALGQGGFTGLMNDNITDALLAEQDELITFKFFPDKNKAPYVLTQGILGVVKSWPVDNQNQAVCTITAEKKSASFAS